MGNIFLGPVIRTATPTAGPINTSKETKMNILIILAHPQSSSFNHAIAATAGGVLRAAGHAVVFHDLYAEGFDPVLPAAEIPKGATLPHDIQNHCDELVAAEGIVIVHPNWWGQPPAILKGWVDRVVRPGVAYDFLECDGGEGVPKGLLQARAAMVFNTSNTPAAREAAVFGDPLERLWKDCIFRFCGVETVHRRMFSVICTSTPEQRATWLAEVEETVHQAFG